MSQNYGPFPAVCGQTPASVHIAGLGPKCIRCVLEENESAKYFNTLALSCEKSSKNGNVLVLHFKKDKYVHMEMSLEILVRLRTKLEKKREVKQLKSMS